MPTPHPFLNVLLTDYTWCLNCQKVHATDTWEKNNWQCPACGGSADDVWRWEDVRTVQSLHPEMPEEGGLYPVHAAPP